MALGVTIVFWGAALGLLVMHGPKIPLVFAVLWAVGYWGIPALGWNPAFVTPYEAALAVFLLMAAKLKAAF